MILVTTSGSGSMDLYAMELAARLPAVTRFPTEVYERSVRRFNSGLLGGGEIGSLVEDVRFVRALRRQRDVIHLPSHHLARYGPFIRNPYVVTVHDLIRYFDLQRHIPMIHRPNVRDRLYLGLDYRGIRHANAIIAVSQTTRADLIEHLGVPAERIHVVYEGVDTLRFRKSTTRPFDFPYILYVGSEQPRKNLGTLIEAFARLKRSGRHPDLRLVKVGSPGGRESNFRAATERLLDLHDVRDATVFVDRAHEDVLPAFYSGAACTVLPSLYEGFGLTILEAMACESPVVASSGGSIPEIAGDAALVVSPRDPGAMADAIARVLTDEELRLDLGARGAARARKFTWQRTAWQTQQVYATIERDPVVRRQLGAAPAGAATG